MSRNDPETFSNCFAVNLLDFLSFSGGKARIKTLHTYAGMHVFTHVGERESVAFRLNSTNFVLPQLGVFNVTLQNVAHDTHEDIFDPPDISVRV